MNIVIPMAGRGKRFVEAGYTTPKPLIKVLGKPMYSFSIESLPLNMADRLIFIALSDHLEASGLEKDIMGRFGDGSYSVEIMPVSKTTEGQACTVLLAKKFINNDLPLLIHNVDTYFVSNLENTLFGGEEWDGIISVFKDTDPKWSFVKVDAKGRVTEVAEKKPISDLATTGMYFFRRGRCFIETAERMISSDMRVNNEFYVAPVYNLMIEEGANIGIDVARDVYCFGTPEELEKSVSVLPKNR